MKLGAYPGVGLKQARQLAEVEVGKIAAGDDPQGEREEQRAGSTAQELQDYEIRVDENANDRYGAFRVGTHDDLVTALGLAVQLDDYFHVTASTIAL
jgi:hypothetical protein